MHYLLIKFQKMSNTLPASIFHGYIDQIKKIVMDINTSVGLISHLLSCVMPVVKFVFHIPEDERCFSNTSLTQQDHFKGITSSAILTCTSPGAADRHCFSFFFGVLLLEPLFFLFILVSTRYFCQKYFPSVSKSHKVLYIKT